MLSPFIGEHVNSSDVLRPMRREWLRRMPTSGRSSGADPSGLSVVGTAQCLACAMHVSSVRSEPQSFSSSDRRSSVKPAVARLAGDVIAKIEKLTDCANAKSLVLGHRQHNRDLTAL